MNAGAYQASPDQGQSNGSGGASAADKSDIKNDTVSSESVRREMAFDMMIERLENVLTRLEN